MSDEGVDEGVDAGVEVRHMQFDLGAADKTRDGEMRRIVMPLDLPEDLRAYQARSNSGDRRRQVCGIPAEMGGWTFETFVADLPQVSAQAREITALLAQWAAQPQPQVSGLVLCGGTGLGKTGLMVSVVDLAASRMDGDLGVWNLVCGEGVESAVLAGTFRRRPAPVMFYRWSVLKALLDGAKVNALGWEEDPPLTADKVLRELEERCTLLALDDIDIDVLSPWKEEILLRLCEFPTRGQRLLLTLNSNPGTVAGLAALGERLVDRLLDPRLFARLTFTGPSLRRRR